MPNGSNGITDMANKVVLLTLTCMRNAYWQPLPFPPPATARVYSIRPYMFQQQEMCQGTLPNSRESSASQAEGEWLRQDRIVVMSSEEVDNLQRWRWF